MFGFEANLFLVALTHDQAQIAAFSNWTNIHGIIFISGIGFGIIGRRDVAHLLCQNESSDPVVSQEQYLSKKTLCRKCKDVFAEKYREDHYSTDAKNLAYFNVCQTAVAGLIISTILFTCKTNLASVYTDSSDVLPCLENLLFIYGFAAMGAFSFGLSSCLMRLTNNTAVFSQQAFIFSVLLQLVLSYSFCITFGMKAAGL